MYRRVFSQFRLDRGMYFVDSKQQHVEKSYKQVNKVSGIN